jgi:hypothetical protein
METSSRSRKGKKATADLDIPAYDAVSATRHALGIDIADKAILVACSRPPADGECCYLLVLRNHAFSRREG